MSYQVTARKWRPMVFEDVVGQGHVTGTLKNALGAGRIAHAYIFSGTRGCGKTTTARILARAVNCESPRDNNPDNACPLCTEIISGRSLDVIEIDGASNRGIEEIRNLRESVRYAPAKGRYKLYIIDEVHMLTKEAFNALLKTLEEPPSHVIFVFATTEIHKVPMTILSRCQRFDFRRIPTEEIVRRLDFIAREEKITIDEASLLTIARKGDGSMRDAQSIFDQVVAFCGDTIAHDDVRSVLNVVDHDLFFRCSSVISERDARAAIAVVDEVVRSGADLREFVGGLAEHYRNLLIVRSTGSSELVDLSASFRKRYEEAAPGLQEGDILRTLKVLHELESSIRFAGQPRYKLEATMLQLVRMESTVVLEDLLKRMGELQQRLEQGERAPARPAAPERSASSRTNIQVVGAVNAGPMSSQIVQKYAAFFSRPASAPSAPSAAQQTVQSSASTDDLAERWTDIVNEVLRTRIAIGTTLNESRMLDVLNGTLRIGCPDDYHVSTLRRHKEFLAETVFRLTGARVLVEPVLHAEKPSVITYTPKQSDPPRKSVIETGGTEDHPVVVALKKELGAERVD